MAEDTIGLLDALGIRPAYFLASSMGSCVAVMIAAQHPERIKGLILHVENIRR